MSGLHLYSPGCLEFFFAVRPVSETVQGRLPVGSVVLEADRSQGRQSILRQDRLTAAPGPAASRRHPVGVPIQDGPRIGGLR